MTMPTTYSSVIVCLLEPIARVRVRDGHAKEENRRDDEDHVHHGLPSERRSVEVESNLSQEEVVAGRDSRVPDRVPCVDRDVRSRLDDEARREVAGCVFSRVPVRLEPEVLVDRLLEAELSSRALGPGR